MCGLFAIGNRCFGRVNVSGRILVPKPPAISNAFMPGWLPRGSDRDVTGESSVRLLRRVPPVVSGPMSIERLELGSGLGGNVTFQDVGAAVVEFHRSPIVPPLGVDAADDLARPP